MSLSKYSRSGKGSFFPTCQFGKQLQRETFRLSSQLHGEDERQREEDGEAPDDDDVQHSASEPGRGVELAPAPRRSPAAAAASSPAARGRVDDHFVPVTENFCLYCFFFKIPQIIIMTSVYS